MNPKDEQMSNLESLCGALRRARSRYKVPLRDLCAELGLSAAALSQIESGKSLPSAEVLRLYADRFRLDLDELLKTARQIGVEL